CEMDNIVSFKEFRNARKRPFEVAWRCDTNLIEHKTTLVATSKDDAESVFKSLFPAKNIRINHVVEDPTIKIYWVQMQKESRNVKVSFMLGVRPKLKKFVPTDFRVCSWSTSKKTKWEVLNENACAISPR